MAGLLSPFQALPHLEEIQCLPPEKISQALSSLLPRIQYPHPKLTQCMHDLLIIHPHQTIPHLPDILPNDASVIYETVETLSELLASDRTLLVPILATLASLPLSTSHRHQIRFTQQYALSVVDEKDLPAVVRSLVRTTGRRGVWSTKRLREGLSRTISDEILPVVSAALCDLSNAKHPITKYILANPRLEWLDIHVFASLLSRPSARRAQFPPVQRALTAAMRDFYPNPSTALALRGMPNATRHLLSIMVSACDNFPSDIAMLACFTMAALRECPEASSSVVADLARGGPTAQMILHALVVNGVAVKSITLTPHIRAAVAAKTDGWHGLFVMLRKSLLFGEQKERERALRIAHCIVNTSNMHTIRDVVSMLDASVPASLADSAAVGLLSILTSAVMRGYTAVEGILERRILLQCPPNFLQFVTDSSSTDSGQMHIDIGLVWDQNLSAISAIVGAGSVLRLISSNRSQVENISENSLNAVVLVPLVCVTLYQAVDDLTIEAQAHKYDSESDDVTPESLADIPGRDLAAAVAAFGASMAALIGIINVSSKCVGNFGAALAKRGSARSKILTTLFERLLEFDRMFTAMQVAFDLLQKQHFRKDTVHPNTSKRTNRGRGLQSGFDLARSVRAAVHRALMGPSQTRKTVNDTALSFPLMSLKSIVCSLISVPDESNIRDASDDKAFRSTRDIELLRIEKIMVRQLCWCLQGEPREAVTGEVFSPASKVAHHDFSDVLASLDRNITDTNAERRRFEAIFPDLEADLASKDDIFMTASPSELLDETDACDQPNGLKARYAQCKNLCVENESPYIRSAVEALVKSRAHQPRCNYVVELIHTPLFVAMLLDRATAYVALARKARKSSTKHKSSLSNAVTLSGLHLCCLNRILLFVSGLKHNELSESPSRTESSLEGRTRLMDFFHEIGHLLQSDVRHNLPSEVDQLEHDEDLSPMICKTLKTIAWISQCSVDSSVATKALEALLIASEVGIVTKRFVRQITFKSLTLVYEYDGGALWSAEDIELLQNDYFTSWSLKRRRTIDSESLCVLGIDPEPWIDSIIKHGRHTSLEHFRLRQYFTGMFIPNAVDEACGWIRELSKALRKGGEYRPKRSEEKDAQYRNGKHVAGKFVLCDILLDMIGLRTILETLMHVAVTALRSFQVSESLSSDDRSFAHGTPIPTLSSALRLFDGSLQLHQRNRDAIFRTKSSNPGVNDLAVDSEIDHSVGSYCITILQLSRTRIEELLFWYSNPSVDVSRLPNETVELIQGLVGSAARIVKQCTNISDTIKGEYSAVLDNTAASNSASSKRKSPGYVKRKRKQSHLEPSQNMTKAYKLIPKLISCCENVVTSVKKLSKTIGIRANRSLISFAPVPISEDPSLSFGIGIRYKGKREEDMNMSGDHHNPPNPLSEGCETIDEDVFQTMRENSHKYIAATGDSFKPSKQTHSDTRVEPETVKIEIRRGGNQAPKIPP